MALVRHVSTGNTAVWLLTAVVPLGSGLTWAFLDQNTGDQGLLILLIALQVVLSGVLADFDAARLTRAGFAPPHLGWVLLAPAYLWRRGSKLIAAAFFAFLAVEIAIASPSVNQGFLTGFGLPACGSAIAEYEIGRELGHSVVLQDVLQTSFDGRTRTCYSKVAGQDFRYSFLISQGTLVTKLAKRSLNSTI